MFADRLKKKKDMVYLCTGFTMLPLHQNDGTKTALGLRYGDCRFLPNANCGKKNLSRGKNGRVGRVSGNKTFFFLALYEILLLNLIQGFWLIDMPIVSLTCQHRPCISKLISEWKLYDSLYQLNHNLIITVQDKGFFTSPLAPGW